MDITFCHLIGAVAAYVGISAIKNKKTSIGPADDWRTDDEETEVAGVWASLIGVLLLCLGGYLIFFKETGCAPISILFR